MALFNFLILNGYASGSKGGRFTHLLLAVTIESKVKLQQIHNPHLAQLLLAQSLNKLEVIFPIHYVYGWLGTYFQTYFDYPHHRHAHPKMVKFSGEKTNRTLDAQEAQDNCLLLLLQPTSPGELLLACLTIWR